MLRTGADASTPLPAATAETAAPENANPVTAAPQPGTHKRHAHQQRGPSFGIVSIYDILAWTVFQKLFDKLELEEQFPAKKTEERFKQWLEVEEDIAAYFETAIGELVGYTSESAVSWTLRSTDPVSSLLQMLSTPPYHRVLVVDVDAAAASLDLDTPSDPVPGSSVVIVTQTDVLRWLMDVREKVAPTAMNVLFSAPLAAVDALARSKPIRRADMDANQVAAAQSKGLHSGEDNVPQAEAPTRQRVVSVPTSFSALAAFRLMYVHRVTAVAVVDDRGRLCANLSASDLRGLTADRASLDFLLRPSFEFLESRHRRPDAIKADQLLSRPDFVSMGSAAADAVAAHLHRVWIVDPSEHPRACVTLSDMLAFFVAPEDVAFEM
ncbi:hypothetical protein HK405_009933 [Cladochytrium tenue]|nr:hypothetical protein HK405_009933 [Cladochytrium tenue]